MANYRSLVGGYFSATPYDRSIPASIRCNNPGAINGASWERTFPGYVTEYETTSGNKTTVFEAPEYGVAAWWELLRLYRGRGITTVGGIINTYGGGQDYSAYIDNVVERSGLARSTSIDLNDDKMLLALGRAMFRYEAGKATPWSDAQILCGFKIGRDHSFQPKSSNKPTLDESPVQPKTWWQQIQDAIINLGVIRRPSDSSVAPHEMPAHGAGQTMLILRGIQNKLDEPSALEYARRTGYVGRVLDVSGETGPASPQTLMALREFRRDKSITAFYGFSGGGYNVLHILIALTPAERNRIKKIVVLGAPQNPATVYAGDWELVYRTDPPGGHMDGPRALLAELSAKAPAGTDLGASIRRVMMARKYLWFPDQNVVSVEGMDYTGKPNRNRPNAFDDCKMVLDGTGKIIGGPWSATTQPGSFWTHNRMNPAGAFIIATGQQSVWTPGDYRDNTVWRQAPDSRILGYRDDLEDYTRHGAPRVFGDIGVHHHGGGDQDHNDIGRRAAGCQVIEYDRDQAEFMKITLACDRYRRDRENFRLTATVLEAKDVLP